MPGPSRLQMARQFAGKALLSLFDPAAARQTYGLMAKVHPTGQGEPPKRGTREFLQAYSTSPWLRAAVERVAISCSSVTWRLYVPTDSAAPSDGRSNRPFATVTIGHRRFQVPIYTRGLDRLKSHPARIVQLSRGMERTKALEELADSGKLRVVEDHPLLDLLQGVNGGYLVGSDIRKLLHIHLDTVGDAFWLKQRNEVGMPVAVWPLPPHWVSHLPTPGHRFFTLTFRGFTGPIDIPETEILWFTDPDPSNPYGHGSGIARALGDELDTDQAAAHHLRRFFYNGGRPDVLITGEGLSLDNTRDLESAWMARSREFFKAGLPFFMNEKATVQELGTSFRDQTIVPIREHERDIIVNVIGLPPEVLGIIENSNRATIDAADYLMARYVSTPRLEKVREVKQVRLVPEYDERLILDYDSPIMEDKEFHLKVMQAQPVIPQVDEWRELMGLEPMGGKEGKLHMVPMGVTAVKKLSELAEPAAPPPGLPGGGGNGAPQLEPGEPEPTPEPAKPPVEE
jgi:phage portal protein BeeE